MHSIINSAGSYSLCLFIYFLIAKKKAPGFIEIELTYNIVLALDIQCNDLIYVNIIYISLLYPQLYPQLVRIHI